MSAPVPVGGAGHHSRVFSYGADGTVAAGSPGVGSADAIGSPSIIDTGSPPGGAPTFGSPPSVYQMPMSPDEDDEEADAVRARGDAFFEDDLAFDDDAEPEDHGAGRPEMGAAVPLRNSAGQERPGLARFGTLSFPGVAAMEEEDEEEVKRDLARTLTIQRNAEQMEEFKMGGDLTARDDDDAEEEAQAANDENGDEFDQDVVIGALEAYADEDDQDDPFHRSGGLIPSASMGFSANPIGLLPSASMGFSANPIGLPRVSSMGFAANPLAAAGDDDDFGDNAIGQDGVYLFDEEEEQKSGDAAFANALAHGGQAQEEEDEEIVHFRIDQHVHVPDPDAESERKHQEEEQEDPEYQYGAAADAGQLHVPLNNGIEGSSPSAAPQHHPQQASRVFSYGGDEDGVSGGAEGQMQLKGIAIGVIPEDQPQSVEDAEVAAAVNRARAAPSPSPSGSPQPSPLPMVRRVDGSGVGHARSDSLQVPGFGGAPSPSGGLSPSPSPQSGRLTPTGSVIVRPSFASLQGSTVHNKGLHRPGVAVEPASPEGGDDGSHERRISYITPVDLSAVQAEHRAELDALMTVAEHKVQTTFPYSLETPVGKDAYELLSDLPAVGESRRVAEFQEPVLGAISAIKNEQVKSVLLSDVILDRSEAPTRFTRAPRKREFAPNVSLRGLAALTAEIKAQRSHAHIECLLLFNEKAQAAIKQDVANMIGALTGLQTIQFQDMKIKSWEQPLTLPNLLNLDIRSCGIKDLSRVTQICLNSPQLYSLTMSDNPICDKFVDLQSKKPTLPPIEHAIWKSLLLRLPNLEYFNLIPIDNATRQRAWAYTKSKKLHPLVASALWNCAINTYAPVQALGQAGQGWKPQAILEVSLGAMSLLSFNVYPLRHSLQVLDLRQNQITTLVGSGLHLCTRLVSVNLSLNKLHDTDELFMLGHLSMLQSVWLEGNPHLPVDQYTSVVIYATRHVQGLNRSPGLQQLDGAAITFDQRMAAYATHAPNSKQQSAVERWRLLLIQQLGHVQLQTIPGNFVSLHMPSRPLLEFADVSALTGLVSLDLRGNKLKAVGGLEKLVRLRVLDVRFNPELVHKLLIAQVQALGPSIEWVSLSHSEEEMLDLTGLRAKFLAALLPHCPKLAVLDHRRILAVEYVRTWKKHKNLVDDSPELGAYKLNLGLVMSNTPVVGRRFDPLSVVPNLPGSQVMFESVHTLHLSGMKLTDSFPLPDLPNLTLLDLSHNKLTLMLPLGLFRFPQLLYLDLRHNKIKFTPMEYASSISVCHKLHAVAIAGNPGVTPKFRQKLIACIPELASLDCELKIIDTYVAIDERVAAWGAASHVLAGGEEGASPSPSPVPPSRALEGLDSPASDASDLSGAASPSVVSPPPPGKGHQKHLSIRHQPLPAGPTDSRAYQHTLKVNATNLSIHELAKRTLKKERELAMTAESRPKADSKSLLSPSSGSTGLSSPSSASPASPSGVNSRLIAMHSNRQVVKVAPLSKAAAAAAIREQEALERNIFKYHLVLQEYCPPGLESSAIKELPLVGLTLQWVDVHAFSNLTKLLISRNQLTTLAHCGIETLKHLIVLDAHHNRLWNLSEVIGICNELPQLVVINFFRNPFAAFDRGEVAAVEKTSAGMGLQAVADNEKDRAVTPETPRDGVISPTTLGVPIEKRERRDSFSSSHTLLTPEKYRLTFIGHLLQLQSPSRCLKFLDHAFVTEDEIIHGLKELGHSAADREMFRFNSIVFDKNGLDPAFTVLKLHARKLQRSDFSRFPYLTSLDIHRNLYTDESLLASHLPKLQHLVELDLSDNRIKEMKPLAAMIQALPKLKHLRILNNPGYPKMDSDNARKRFLACFSNVHMVSFSLEYLNQQLITIEERILALHEMKLRWNQIHPANMLDRMRSVEIHTTVAKDVMTPKQLQEEEKKMADHAAAPPPVVAGGVDAQLAAAAAPPAAAAPVKLMLQDPSQIAASKEASLQQIMAQGGTPLNLDEDVTVQGENARFILSCAAAEVKPGATELCLRKRNLRLLGGMHLGIASYEALCIVDLRENNLSDLTGSGIDQLKKMHTLDLRANEFTSLETLVVSLRGCNALKWLYLQFSTKSRDETSTPAQYVPGVFADLRGLHRLDDIENEHCVTKNPIALSAQQLLWKIARIGPNNLKRVDLSNRRLPTTLFYTVLSALYYLDIQELLAGGNNEWSLHPQYSDVIILLLGPKFRWLDGVAITDQRRMLAFRADKQGKQSGKITGNIVVWEDQYTIIHEEVDEWLAADRAKHGEYAADGVGDGKKKPGDVDHRLNMPNMQAVNVNNAAASSNASNNPNILSKLDIIVHYLQVYGMVLVMDINIPYPQAFDDWSSWIRLSTLNLEDLFTLDSEYQQEVLFGVVMLAPAMLLGLYFYFDRLRGRQDDWADSYVTKWRATKWRAFIVWLLFNVIGVGCCFFFIGNFESFHRVRDGGVPTSVAATWMLVIFCISTVWYFFWWRTVALFQKHWNKDDSELKQDFKASWLNFIHWMQILFLFIITSIYLPVARVILIQFACDCITENADNLCTSRLYSNNSCFPHPVTRVQGAAFVFAVLYILLLPLFIIKLIREGIAIVMDLNTVYELLQKEVLILQSDIKTLKRQRKEGPKAGEAPEQSMANAAAISEKILEHKAAIVAKKKQMEKEYFGRINDPIRKLASTSLYSAYEYDWRFWKIIQLVQNLCLVCISLFVPSTLGLITEARIFLGCFAIGGFFLFACWVRPYYDSWEDGMEIMAGFANTVTILVALGLQYRMSWLTSSRANAILFAANITAVFAFIVAIIIVPFRVCRQRRRHKKATKEAEARMKALNEENKKKRAARIAAAKAAEAGGAVNGGAAAAAANGGNHRAVVPVSIEMQPVKRK